MTSGVVTLWSLLEACRAGRPEEQLGIARELSQVLDTSRSVCLRVDHGRLVYDGVPASSDVDTLAATHGLLAFLRDVDLEWVEFSPEVTVDELCAWARRVVGGPDAGAWPGGVATGFVAARAEGSVDSQLRSVFVQNHLVEAVRTVPGVDLAAGKAILQGVVDRLLQIPGGLEPLMLLQQDEALLQRSTSVAVLTVWMARRAGWPMGDLADLGVAGLLYDLGSILSTKEPAAAAFRWLLTRGDCDSWLRSAIVAGGWRRMPSGAEPAALTLVRMAIAVASSPGEDARSALCDIARAAAAPDDLAELAAESLAVA